MSVTDPATARLVDAHLPEVASLLVEGVPDPLAIAMDASGAKVAAATAIQVTWWPGQSITVRYRAQLTGGGLDGEHALVAVAGDLSNDLAVVEGEAGVIGVWRVPFDPLLPGLKQALDPVAAGHLLRELGYPGDTARPRLVAYRPGNRAVVKVQGPSGAVFLKLVAPSRVERLHATHRTLAPHLPIPASLGVDPALGLVALRQLAGVTLRQALIDGGSLPLPSSVMSFVQALPNPTSSKTTRSPLERLPTLLSLLGALLPDQVEQLEALKEAIGVETLPPSVPVHGDFYEAQVIVRPNKVVGVLDVDTFGWGRPADDAGTFLAHLAVLDQSHPSARLRRWASDLLHYSDQVHDPEDLRRRIAAAIVGLALGPFRVQRPRWPALTRNRLDLAMRWCESANRVTSGNDRDLISAASGRV